jgi:hypothetical protein
MPARDACRNADSFGFDQQPQMHGRHQRMDRRITQPAGRIQSAEFLRKSTESRLNSRAESILSSEASYN